MSRLPQLRIVTGHPRDVPTLDGLDGELHRDHAGTLAACARTLEGARWLYVPGLAWYRLGERTVDAFPEDNAPADQIRESFIRVALPMALQASGSGVLHASAVAESGGVHVFCGASRSGKSTIAFALSRRGFEVWADDAVSFAADDGAAIAVPLPFALRLRHDVADFFGIPTQSDSSFSRKSETLRAQATERRRIASVSLLERGPESTVDRLSAGEAFPAVLYHAFYFSLDDPAVRRRMSTQFLELVASVPVFRISLPVGLTEMNDALDDVERLILTAAAT
jgi:hypothetical protein